MRPCHSGIGHDADAAEHERPLDHVRRELRDAATEPRRGVEHVVKRLANVIPGGLRGVALHRRALHRVEAAQLVEPQDVVGVAVGVDARRRRA